jgi:hypothetical protein
MKYLIILLLILFSLSLDAQQTEKHELQELYWDQLHPSDPLLNGREYTYYFKPHSSTPLIPKNPQASASAIIRDRKHQNLSLLYDTHKDLLVYYNPNTLHNNTITTLIISHNIVKEFDLQLPSGEARFQYLEFPEKKGGLLGNGYYEIVREGSCKLIIDHRSEMNIKEGMIRFEYSADRYILSTGKVYKIRGKKSLVKALSDQATEVEEYLRRRKIHVRSASIEQLAEVIDYYTHLNQSEN